MTKPAFKQNDVFKHVDNDQLNACVGNNGGPYDLYDYAKGYFEATNSRSELERVSVALLDNEMPLAKPVRLLGVSLSSLQGNEDEEPQLGLPI